MISKYILKITFIATILICLQGAAVANTTEVVNKIDKVLNEKFQPNDTGAVFLVAKGDEPIYRNAFGKANIELDVDMETNNVFQIGSMTKQFTALVILILHEQKKLDVNDSVSKYLPKFPNGKKITLHHLLTHTSGIKDFTKIKSLWTVSKKDHSPQELIDFFKNEPVDFRPGEKFQYNNSGYALLGYIIELVSGETYENFVEEHIFKALGMKDSRYANDREVIGNRAYGYHNKGKYTNRIMVSLSLPYSSGSLMSTADDMLIWQQAIDKNLLIKPSTMQMAFSKYTLNNGKSISYGYGWHLKNINGVPVREHGGSIFGFKSMGIYIPSIELYVIGLTNCDCNSPTQITKDIAALFIE